MQEDKNVNKKGFLKGMRSELKKVIWPSGKQTVKSTFVTIAFVLIISVVLIVLNLCFSELNKLWIKSLGQGDVINNNFVSGDVNNQDIIDNVFSGEINSGDMILDDVLSGDILSGEVVSGE